MIRNSQPLPDLPTSPPSNDIPPHVTRWIERVSMATLADLLDADICAHEGPDDAANLLLTLKIDLDGEPRGDVDMVRTAAESRIAAIRDAVDAQLTMVFS